MKTSKRSSHTDYKVITVSVVISDSDASCDKRHPRVFTCCLKNTSTVIPHGEDEKKGREAFAQCWPRWTRHLKIKGAQSQRLHLKAKP